MSYARLLELPRWSQCAFWLGSLGLVMFLGGLPGTIQPENPGQGWPYFTNLLHQPLYALVGLGLLLLLRLPSDRGGQWALVICYALGIGILDEIHQSHTEARSSSLWDLGSDGYGAFCAAYLAHLARSQGWFLRALPTLALLVVIGLAWNCLPTFAQEIPLPFLR